MPSELQKSQLDRIRKISLKVSDAYEECWQVWSGVRLEGRGSRPWADQSPDQRERSHGDYIYSPDPS
jgi:hypothetical protein